MLSHGRDIMILKVVGYAEAIVQYYKIGELCAHVWIAHQRFPTKGRVWHPAGAHPFAGINMALVHNGDFANYHSVTEYLLQRNIYPLFLTDTEVSALLFDLLNRTYHYPLEYIIEAMAPTSELDFDRLFKLIISHVTETLEAERTSLYIIDWNNNEIWTKVAEQIGGQIRLSIGDGISGRVAQTGGTCAV